jgi:PAS domain S-box-containing protein
LTSIGREVPSSSEDGVPQPAWLVAAVAMTVGYLALAGYVWRHRDIRGAREMTAFILAVATRAVFFVLLLGSRDVAAARIWLFLGVVGGVSLPPLLWAFVTRYVGRGSLRSRTWMAFWIEPTVVLVLLALPATRDHVLFFGSPPRRLLDSVIPQPGPLFWPHAAYSYALQLGAVVVLSNRLLRVPAPYRRQAYALAASTVVPLASYPLYLLTRGRVPVDPTPLLVTLTAVLFVWGLLRPRLLDVPAVSRSVVMQQLTDGVFVLDVWGRIVDANPASVTMLAAARPGLVGRSLDDVLPPLANAIRACPDRGVSHRTVTTPIGDQDRRGGPRDLVVSVTGLTDPADRPTAKIVVVRDVTERSRDVRRLRELLTERTAVVETLEQILRPDVLPDVDGVAIAARWLPADGGAAVSGDFYDVHPVGPTNRTGVGRWGFVLGDVSGRGVRAAVLTSMARQILRTLSAQGGPPHAVLEQLNEALIQGNDPEQFCTVAYGQITGCGGGSGPGRRITLALGGHPLPLLRERSGKVQPVGVPGTALGLLDQVDVTDVEVVLSPGDVLLMFTDGVPEARRDGEQFGERRLAQALDDAVRAVERNRTPGGRCPGVPVEAIADLITERVREFADQPDDVAVLVLGAR